MGRRGAGIHRRLIVIAIAMVLWGAVIGVRLYSLQVVQSADFKERANGQHERVIEISPRRGSIYDRNGNELAVSIEVDSLYAVASEIEDPEGTAAFLADVLDSSAESMESRLNSDRGFTWVQRKISKREADRVRSANIRGLYFQKESKRFYPNRELASHVLGGVDLDDAGAGGIEYRYNDLIAGPPGKVVAMIDARGRSFHRLEQLPASGANLTTTIDRTIQYIAEREVARTIAQTQAAGMSVVAMDPSTGEILAMANYPQFNPNEYGRFPAENRRNRAIGQNYEPGSTFKIVTVAASLEESLTTLDEVIDCQMGHIDILGHRINDHKPFGLLSVREILQYSSDVGAIKLGMRLGDERFADYIVRMGFGRRTGVDLPAEERGLFRPAAQWSSVSVGAISMGQEIAATPLQVVNMVSTVANGGTLYQPHVVKRVEDPLTGRVAETRSVGQRVIGEETAHLLRDALQAVVADGTGANARIPGFTVAGKTGTAQKIDPETRAYSLTAHVASFTGFAPVLNPEVAVVVVIDEPVGPHGGGEVAAPAFKRIVEEILRYRSVVPDAPTAPPRSTDDDSAIPVPADPAPQPDLREDMVEDWEVVDVTLRPETPVQDAGTDGGIGTVRIPDFDGLPLRRVTETCMQLGLKCQSGGSGFAIAQSVPPGTFVPWGAAVQVRLSTTYDRSIAPAPVTAVRPNP